MHPVPLRLNEVDKLFRMEPKQRPEYCQSADKPEALWRRLKDSRYELGTWSRIYLLIQSLTKDSDPWEYMANKTQVLSTDQISEHSFESLDVFHVAWSEQTSLNPAMHAPSWPSILQAQYTFILAKSRCITSSTAQGGGEVSKIGNL